MKHRRVLFLTSLLLIVGGVAIYRIGIGDKSPGSTVKSSELPAAATAQSVAAPVQPIPAPAAKEIARVTTNAARAAEPVWPKPYITAAGSAKATAQPRYKFNSNPQARTLAKYDANADGKLDPAEKAVLQQRLNEEFAPLRSQMLAAYDADKNGMLDLQEQQAGRQAELEKLQKLRTALLPKYDLNRNGAIDPDEQTAIRQDGQDFLKRVKTDLLSKYDANHNGILDPEESATIKAVSERVRETLKNYDLNGDGRLDDAERAKAKSDLENKAVPAK